MKRTSPLLALLAFCASGALLRPVSAQAAEPAAESFAVFEYRVLGNTLLPALDIERTLYPLLGEGRRIEDVEAARAALEARYRAAGYGTVFVDIPEQEIAEGVVRLKVTEGTLEAVRVKGARYVSGRAIRNALPTAKLTTAPDLPALQAELATYNARSPDRTVTPILKAGTQPGTVDLTLNVQDKLPLHGRLEVNDQYTTNTTRLRAIAQLSYDNLFDRLDSLSVQFQTAPEATRQASVWAFSYTARLPDDANKLSFYYINSDSSVATVGDGGSSIGVLGKGQIFGGRFIRLLANTSAGTHVLQYGAEYKDFIESVLSTSTLQTPISYLNLSMGHISSWNDDSRQWSLASSANFGLRGSVNSPVEFADKRFRARPNYFYVRADGSVQQALPWGLALRLRMAGQYAGESIISNEQFSVAGADGVRGYREAETLGDIGYKSSLELRTPAWQPQHSSAQAFVFADYGLSGRLNPLREQDPRTNEPGAYLEKRAQALGSLGVGLNFTLLQFLSGDLTWAYPLVDMPAESGTQAGQSRVHFSMRSTW
jgi:hemolysin activation/secretion protein